MAQPGVSLTVEPMRSFSKPAKDIHRLLCVLAVVGDGYTLEVVELGAVGGTEEAGVADFVGELGSDCEPK